MSTPPVGLPEFLDHLNMTAEDATDVDELELTLEAATDLVESHVGPMVAREVTQVASTSPDGTIVLRSWPVSSVTTITDPDGGEVDVETVEQYAGVLSVPYPGVAFGAGRHTVVYEAGWVEVPAALKLATMIVARHLWETQRPSGSGLGSGRFGVAEAQRPSRCSSRAAGTRCRTGPLN
jgi:hypothetical protein